MNFKSLLIGIFAGNATQILAFSLAEVPHTAVAVVAVTVASVGVGIAALAISEDV